MRFDYSHPPPFVSLPSLSTLSFPQTPFLHPYLISLFCDSVGFIQDNFHDSMGLCTGWPTIGHTALFIRLD